VRLEIFMALKFQIIVFWVLTPCSDMVRYQDTIVSEDLAASIFRVLMEAVKPSKTLVSYCITTWCQPTTSLFIFRIQMTLLCKLK